MPYPNNGHEFLAGARQFERSVRIDGLSAGKSSCRILILFSAAMAWCWPPTAARLPARIRRRRGEP